ncbi:MAG: PAS domain S-box protein [Terracidiphilus sp.]
MRIHAEANLSALIESTEDLIWSVDPRLRLITFNRAFQKHFEKNFGGPVAPGMGLRELLPPARAFSWPPLYDRALKGERFRAEVTLIDGRILDLSFSPILVDEEITGVSVFGKDITEAKAAEKKYRDIFEGALEGFFQTAPEGKLLIANRTLARMLGYDSQEDAVACITDSARQLWMDAEERARVMRRIEEQGFIRDYECRFKRKDGSLVWVLLNCRCARNANGGLICFEGSIQDVTERKRAEDALKKTEANLSALIESTSDLIWAVDLDYRKVVFNRALKENVEGNFGTKVEPGMRAEDDLPPERAALWKPLYDRALRDGPYRTEYLLVDGRTLELSFNPIRVDGKPVGVSVFGKEITERMRAEKQLRDSEELYRATFDQVAFGIAHCSFEGIYLRGNHRFAEIIGYPPEEVPGLAVQQVTAPEDLALRMEALERVSSGEIASITDERRYLRKGGSLIWARSTLSLQRDGEGRPLHFIAFVEDIHQRKQTEEALRESSDFLKEAQRIGDLGCYVLDFASGFWTSTAQLDEVFGIGPDFVRSVAGWAQLVHPEDRAMMTDYFNHEVLLTGKNFDKEYRVVRASDGVERWVHGMGRLEFDVQGRPAKMRGAIRDITEHKQAEIAVAEREKLFRAITESSPLAYVITSGEEDRVDYLNPAFVELFGYTREEIPTAVEWALLAYPDPEYRAWAMAEWQRKLPRAFASGSAMEPIETEIACKNGAKKIVVWGYVQLGDLNLAYGLDITEQKQATRELAESEARFRGFFEENSSVMALVDPDNGEIVDANHAAAAYFGYSQEKLIGMTMSQINLMPQEWMVNNRQLALRKERPVSSFPIQLASGEVREIETYTTPFEVGGSMLLFAIAHDVTDRKRAELALQESEARFRRFFEQSGSVMMLVEPGSGVIVDANQAAAKFYGYAHEQLVGKRLNLINTLPEQEIMLEMERTVSEERNHFNFRHRLASGEERDVDVYSSPIVTGGKHLLFSIVHDVTDRKQAELALAGSEKVFRAISESSPLAILLSTGAEKRLEYRNSTFKRLFGYSDEEVPKVDSWWPIAYPDKEYRESVLKDWKQRLERAIAANTSVEPIETEVTCKDGSKKRISWGMVKIDHRTLIFGYDLTEIRQVEKQIQESEERYRTAFQTSIDPMTISRLEDGRFVDVNQAFLRTFACKREQVVGRTSMELKFWKSAQDRRRLVKALREDSVCHDLEFQLNACNGQILSVLVSGALMELDGVPSFLLVIRDITEAKAAEQLLAEAQYALHKSEERHRLAFQTSSNAVNIVRLSDGMLLDVNEAFLDAMGYKREEVMGRTTQELNIWADPDEMLNMVDTLRRDQVFRGEIQLRKKNGEIIWGRMSASVFEHDGVRCSLCVTQDVSVAKASEQRLAEAAEALKKSEARYRTAFQTSIDAININRLSDGLYVDCNQAFLDILGYEREEVVGKSSLELNVWADGRDRLAMVEMVRQNSHCRGLEVQFKKKNGEIVWGEMSASEIEIDGTECILSVTRDISHVKTAENTIRNLAFYDSLTGLPNRRFLSEKLYQIQAASHVGHYRALLFVELDHFKTLNETLGHLTGDLLLKEVAQRISACAGASDIVCRLGGDEFSVMLDELSESAEEAAAQARDAGERIRASIGQPCFLDGRECITTASIGATVIGADPPSIDELLQEADIALYQAKLAGRNTMRFFSPALQSAVNARATLEEDMRQAIKGQQFLLYYQPQVQRGRVIGAEALIRWMHPKNGMVPPDSFIPLAEETGLILPVGDWVLDAACRQIAAWAGRKETAHLAVAVNISALQFRQPGFVETVLNALERTGANPANLKLELTESMLVENIEDVIAKMTVLKENGLSFSLDDFGTGYSSLAYLKRLPLDQLKIDRAFVRDMLVDVTSGAIAQTIISLGRAMGLSVIAEGVESEEQRGFLAGLGCHAFQGTLYSPPLPLEEFEAFI